MSVYVKNNYYTLYQGKMQEELANIPDSSIDSIVTDPPYELGFMGKSWDSSGVAFQPDTWKRCLRVLKPGGYLLAFGGSRTYHRIACAIEDAGFEIRDTIMWLYGSGFPKSMNIGLAIDKKPGVESQVIGVKQHSKKDFKESNLYAQDPANKNNTKCFGYGEEIVKRATNEWQGWGTALKPAFEPIIVARKPFCSSLVDNVLEWGVGGINIDECRVPSIPGEYDIRHYTNEDCFQNLTPKKSKFQVKPQPDGRFPANIITDGSKEVAQGFPDSKSSDRPRNNKNDGKNYTCYGNCGDFISGGYDDEGSAMRFFYSAKASKKDRDEGLDSFDEVRKCGYGYDHGFGDPGEGMYKDRTTVRRNTHPTVKPSDLMQYLIRLVNPKGATILDPFMGSGSTGKAAMIENQERGKDYKFIGIEMTEEYLPIADARIRYWINRPIEVEEDNRETVQKQDTVCQLW